MAFELLDTQPTVRDRPGAARMARPRGEIVYRDVAFAYGGREHTLEGVSFRARPGEVIGIVGPTGAGKSTLVSLLPRFYEPSSGTITLDGVDVRDVTLESLRAQVSLVLQDSLSSRARSPTTPLPGRLEASLAEVQEAARTANAHDFITALPAGYDTEINEKGVGLSGRAAAHRGRARVPEGCAHPDLQRAHLVDRLAHRGGHPRRARPARPGARRS